MPLSTSLNCNSRENILIKTALRTLALTAVAFGGLLAISAPSRAQTLVIGSSITSRLTPTTVPYRPGTVPSQCLAYGVNGQGPVVFCEMQFPTQWDIQVPLMFGGYKAPGFRTPDDCILRSSPIASQFLLYCKTKHW
jgi:hypothetical protein